MILTAREKIILYRKKYKITQKELSQGSCNVSTLSLIEKNKSKLMPKMGEKIVKRFNEIFSERGIEERLDLEWFIRSIDEQIGKRVSQLIIKLYTKDLLNIDEVNEIFSKYISPENKVKVYFALGNYYFKQLKEYKKAKYCYSQVIDEVIFLKDHRILSVILLNLLRINYYLIENRDSLFLYKRYFKHLDNISGEIKGMLLYNFAVAFYCQEKYKTAIGLYKAANDYIKKEYRISSGEITIGVCYQHLGEYKTALDYFQRVIVRTSNISIKVAGYANIISCAREDDNFVLVKTTIPKLESLLEGAPLRCRHQDYYSLGKAYLYLEDRGAAIKNFQLELELGIDMGYSKFNPKSYLETIENLLNLYTIRDKKELKKLKKKILAIPSEMLTCKFMIFSIRRYNELMLWEEVTELLNKFYEKL